MKLGSQTGSMMNHIASRGTIGQPKPEVGMGATLLHWTDRGAATIVSVVPHKNGYRIIVQEDNAKLVSGDIFSESQRYEYTPNPDGLEYNFQCENPDGMWQEMRINPVSGRWNKVKGGNGLKIGVRDKYHDPCF